MKTAKLKAMFAVIETGGKQYIVTPGAKLKVEKLPHKEGDSFAFDKVLLVADDKDLSVGTPYVAKSKVHARIVKQGRRPKITMLKYHNKTRYRRKKGHRQHFTEVQIEDITS